MSSTSRENNFDLIRLLAALQVVLVHAIGHTGKATGSPTLYDQLGPFWQKGFDLILFIPGVPIFFVISGFLIAMSFEKHPADLGGFFWRRALRIFPALWVCLIVTIAALGFFGFLTREFVFSPTFPAWLAGQISFGQFFNPAQFRNFGVGVANGALWTITVELQFYLFVPLMILIIRKLGKKPNILLGILAFSASFLIYGKMIHAVNGPDGYQGAPILYKLFFVTLIPHLWMFLLGSFTYFHFEKLRGWIDGKAVIHIAIYALLVLFVSLTLQPGSLADTLMALPLRISLAFLTLSCAFTCRHFSRRILHGIDLSYGTYLYHMIVINVMIELGALRSPASLAWVVSATCCCAILSWFLIEKPVLAAKNTPPVWLACFTLPARFLSRRQTSV